MNKKLKVRIVCSERVSYDQTVEMTRAEWEKLKSTPERKMEDGDTSPLASLLDLREPISSDVFSDIDIEVVDDENNPIEPSDCYEGGDV